MSSIVSIDTRGYDISMGPGVLRVGGGGGLAGNVYINGNVGIGVINPAARLDVSGLIQSSIAGASSFAQLIRNTTGEGAGWNSKIFVVPYLSTGGYNHLSTLGDVGIIWGAITGTNGSLVIGPHNSVAAGGLKITSTGSVGIGTATPTATLDVNGTMRTTNAFTMNSTALTNSNYIILSNNTNAYALQQIDNAGANYVRLGRNGYGDIVVNSTGNVGIGIESPTVALDVNGGITSSWTAANRPIQVIRNTTGEGDGWNSRLSIVPYLGNNGFNALSSLGDVGIIWGANTGTNGNLLIGAHSQTSGGIKITSTGSVGIGTKTPAATLDVSGQIKTNVGVVIAGDFEIEKSATSKTLLISHYSNPNTPICFYNKFPGGTTKVGIDTTSPAYPLDVSGRLQVSSPGYSSTLNNTQTNGVITHASQTLSAVGWYSAMTWNTLMTTGWSQRVVIGSKRDSLTSFGSAVIGVGNADNTINIEYLFHSNGNFYANGTAYSSDIRLKQNIVDADLNICYNNVKKLKLKRWEWRNNINGLYKNDQHQLGWIAQELEQISPKSVTSINMYEIDDCKHIENTQVISFMYGTIQKLQDITENQQQQIDEHKTQLQTQQSIIQSLEQRLSLLEQRLS